MVIEPQFDKWFRDGVADACMEWGYKEPGPEYYSKFYSRIPEQCQRMIVQAMESEMVLDAGMQFNVLDGRPHHGPYNWFSRDRGSGPGPNWEYFVEVPEFLRLQHLGQPFGLQTYFEYPGEVDISLYRGDKIVLICEVKEKPNSILKLLAGLKEYEKMVDMNEPDRGNDSLRKAKYIMKAKPEWFRVAAIGHAEEFRVTYPTDGGFRLQREAFQIS